VSGNDRRQTHWVISREIGQSLGSDGQ
jgi:hypothetical protein